MIKVPCSFATLGFVNPTTQHPRINFKTVTKENPATYRVNYKIKLTKIIRNSAVMK
jgi:hypothetical protein